MFVAPSAAGLLALDQGRVWAVPPAAAVLRGLGLDHLEGALAFTGGHVARAAGSRCTYAVASPLGPLYVKVYRDLRGRERWLRGRVSPARREWLQARALAAAGFAVPDVLAFGEAAARWGAPRRSFLITAGVPGTPLDRFLAAGAAGDGLAVLARRIREFHAAGFFHRDLYCGHLVVPPSGDLAAVVFLDLARLGRQQPLRRRWRVKDLAALAHSAPERISAGARLRFLLHYLERPRLDREVREWQRAIAAKVRRIRAHVPRYG